MKKPEYCTKNDGNCPMCSLVNYGLDCRNNPVDFTAFAASTLGRRGGQSTSAAKRKASAENGKKGGRPKVKKEEVK